ncbi:DNA-binding helix-turn-helix protein [Leptospira borgpetersenii str. Noumea 25]|uniref:DNA-binding helix-turn-helix protein n=3 Tax=Leptospira borgpetersenii TaxID=174 RepID=M3GJ03_LEPBO|nr:leucine zipper domain-containing protein [Leptospira borgpetersenii]ALO25651.1 DNA-binding helix-turn-helix protein [Leptospira borgpetersenii serovar Ballum]EMG00942.1 DNA-binding helix-turn-helix protein [Leptospira borgpetersenii str. 200701203]EMO10973.1 DNA-binding helix-turn-helix protein [Leptospira borgpetersenii str. Noumea 25]EKP12445.1 DNA-binding helix-turn-helix protein [Leptospira borgpetersenii str. 200801926]ENO62462.1 DNA-binding helix-turn-helix protein [Leptospira borgpet
MQFSDLCKEFGISRKTGYKYLERYESEGLDGLKDRSKKPKKHPNETPENVVLLIMQMWEKHPTWGARKLLWALLIST